MDRDSEPIISPSPDDSIESLDKDDHSKVNYGTFEMDKNKREEDGRHPDKQRADAADCEKQKLASGKRYRKRGDSGKKLGSMGSGKSNKITSREEDVINSNHGSITEEKVNGGGWHGDEGGRNSPRNDDETEGDSEEDGYGRDQPEELEYDTEEDDSDEEKDNAMGDDPQNMTMETVVIDEDHEIGASASSDNIGEDEADMAPTRSSKSLELSISMVKVSCSQSDGRSKENVHVPPEMAVLEKIKMGKDNSPCYDSVAKDCDTDRPRANSKSQGHLYIGRPTNLHRVGSLFSDPSDRGSQNVDWEWIDEPDQVDSVDNPNAIIRSFGSTHSEPKGFRDISRGVFLPHQKLEVTLVDCGRSTSSQYLNPNEYYIDVKHGTCIWTIQRRSNDFIKLHEEILLYKARLVIPFGDRDHLQRRRTFKANRNRDLAHFPRTPDAWVRAQQLPKRMHQYENYLKSLVSNPLYRNHPQTLEFLEVSHLSFVGELGVKGKEGWVQKRSGGHRVPITRCCPCLVCTDCTSVAAHYSKRWLVTKDSFVAYVRPRDGHIRAVMLADSDFETNWGIEETGLNTGLVISNQYRNLLVKCESARVARQWMVAIMEMMSKSEYTRIHRFSAFGPERTDTYAQWFVDGSRYFETLADALESAEQEIFITDWWLNPEIYLKRPAVEGPYWRLDKILQRKAAAGVKIFVLLYKEVDVALALGSKNTKHVLMDLHPNIKVMRHPDHNPGQVILWAHHEKLVAIDQKVAFVGGLDICYGRWDDFKHRLSDLGSAAVAYSRSQSIQQQEGESFIVESDIEQEPSLPVQQFDIHTDTDSVDDEEDNEEAVQSPPETPATPDIEEEGGYFRRPRLKSATIYLKKPIRKLRHEETKTSVDENLDKLGLSGTSKLWIGKDYCNFIAKDVLHPEESLQDSVDRMKTPRMPWHDIGACLYGQVAADVSRHFIQRWNFTKKEKAEKLNHYPLLLPKSTSSIDIRPEHKDISTPCKCQLLRSASQWSVGVKYTEDSIHKAYIKLIGEAKHYIYIENQFFITMHDNNEVTNGIAQALYQRILRAYEQNEMFRVYVFLPLLPAFQGDVGEAGRGAIHTILYWEYQSICRGRKSLIGRLLRAGISDPKKFITFYGLRTHDTLNCELVTELVYIHSKLMIVDDRTIICGSANINDRSLLGKRDSELAVLIEDTEMIPSRMNGQEYMAGKLAFGLRERLFKEHLGVLQGHGEIDVTDPVSDAFYKDVVMKHASGNTAIYEQVFRCLPSDIVVSSAGLPGYKKVQPLYKTDRVVAQRLLTGIHGNITWIPLDFLKEENLQPKITTQEGIAPTKLWT